MARIPKILKAGGRVCRWVKRCKRTSAKNKLLTKSKPPKSANQFGNRVSTIIIILYIYIYTHSITYADYYTRLLYLLSTYAILYTRFFCSFLIVINGKAQHMQKKRHDKKPLQFCNMKKLVKTSTYKN